MSDGEIEPCARLGNNHPIDGEPSLASIGEHWLGEIFGWDSVDRLALEMRRDAAEFEQDCPDRSIYGQLKPLLDRYRSEGDETNALRPSSVLNDNLTKLVGILCRHFGKPASATQAHGKTALDRTPRQEQAHHGVVGYIRKRIETDAMLGHRAKVLKTIAAAAEGELEKQAVDRINHGIEERFSVDGMSHGRQISLLRDQAEGSVDAAQEQNLRDLDGLSVPALAFDDDRLARIEMAKILLQPFPYLRNYELMLLAELAMFQGPLKPRFVRERDLAGPMDAEVMVRLDRSIDDVTHRSGGAQALRWGGGSFAEKTIAFCGSGALPLSALLLHLMTDARLVLIDQDLQAAARSRQLIAHLERLEILAPGGLTVLHQNAASTRFERMGASSERPIAGSLACDAVMIASLVDPRSKLEIGKQFQAKPTSPEFLLLRSAAGLSAKLAYDPVDLELFSAGSLAFCGECLPAHHLATHLDRLGAIQQGVSCLGSKDLLAIAHPDVVNTTELYRKVELSGDARRWGRGNGVLLDE